jgi:hypothetical protein
MDFLFHVPFFCTAGGAVAEIQTVCFVNIEFREGKKLILNQFKKASHFVKIIVACPHCLPKLPESTQRTQAIPNKGSLFYSHCAPYLQSTLLQSRYISVLKIGENVYAMWLVVVSKQELF